MAGGNPLPNPNFSNKVKELQEMWMKIPLEELSLLQLHQLRDKLEVNLERAKKLAFKLEEHGVVFDKSVIGSAWAPLETRENPSYGLNDGGRPIFGHWKSFPRHTIQNRVTSVASCVPLCREVSASHLPMRRNEAASQLPMHRICWRLAPDLLAPRASQGTALLLLHAAGCAKVLAPRAAGHAGVAVHYFFP
ncbi:hypothetical protein HAX54_016442 [Datura stramonium]|uniref:Uncharacterized protein n=1 Tax=Datura stramonium TaxID=4076 RepID=A0ABS8UIV3_DATST|nr:hypothetical protein [Datura stramonium]